MPLVRPPTGTIVRARPKSTVRMPCRRRTQHFHSSGARRGGGGAEHFDNPGGWLWGVPPGTKPKREGWEMPMYWGFCGSLVLAAIAYVYKPDTSIQTWALEEARRRLEAEGILEDPDEKKT